MTLSGHTDAVRCLQFDDKVIVSGSLDKSVRVWNVKTGKLLNTITARSLVLCLRFLNGVLVTGLEVSGFVKYWKWMNWRCREGAIHIEARIG